MCELLWIGWRLPVFWPLLWAWLALGKVEARDCVVKAWALELGLLALDPILATCFMPDLGNFSVS